MNTTCPACGAVYNVATKDIGRRLRCKKCGTGLRVSEAGIEEDTGAGDPADRPEPPDRDDRDDRGDEMIEKRSKRRSRGPGVDPLAALGKIGGVPGLLFGTGVVFALFFTFLQVLSGASNARAAEYETKLRLEHDIKVRKLLPKGKTDPGQLEGDALTKYNDEKKKIDEEYAIPMREAQEDKISTEIGNKRSRLYEGYGQMFGFVFIGFGCLGFLLSESALLLRIVAAIILTAMVMGLFKLAVGASGGVGAGLNIG